MNFMKDRLKSNSEIKFEKYNFFNQKFIEISCYNTGLADVKSLFIVSIFLYNNVKSNKND